jgi:hypothetical protein
MLMQRFRDSRQARHHLSLSWLLPHVKPICHGSDKFIESHLNTSKKTFLGEARRRFSNYRLSRGRPDHHQSQCFTRHLRKLIIKEKARRGLEVFVLAEASRETFIAD